MQQWEGALAYRTPTSRNGLQPTARQSVMWLLLCAQQVIHRDAQSGGEIKRVKSEVAGFLSWFRSARLEKAEVDF